MTFIETKLEDFKTHFSPLLHSSEPMETLITKGIQIFYTLSAQDGWIDMVSVVLQRGVEMNELPKDSNVKEMACSIVAILDGYNLQRSFVDSSMNPDKLDHMIKQLIVMCSKKVKNI
ncbi:hypothetical protein [Brevibacillus sp. 179-C9.3 HS]|uniref:hypothetical protein n=1 Tax=unclassified Brevibacillus TaxID=2684853 RepID=UPI0039A08D97